MEKRKINIPWLFTMAWRDSRRNRSRLMLFISAIIFGIAALVAIYSFKFNLEKDIDNQAATLVGADLAVYSGKAATPPIQHMLDSISNERSQERTFVSMALFSKQGGTRLVQVHALQGAFPYYGSLETVPIAAGTDFKKSKSALVDKVLMLQFNAKVGDSVKIGDLSFLIAGTLNKAPGQTGITSNVAPVIYIPFQYLNQTGLLKRGSRINYTYYFKFAPGTDIQKMVKNIDPKLDKADMGYETVQMRKENTGRSFSDLTHFLSLVGFIALLLGCVGVASAIHIYIREKIASIAIMRCLGVKAREAFLIYLIQIVGIGIVGSVIGSFAGAFVQQVLPLLFKDFIPFQISTDISWLSIGQGVLLGIIISVLFALLPLIAIRSISPLNTLRINYENINLLRDPLRWLVYALILAFVVGFSYLQLGNIIASIFFTIGIGIAFLILTFMAWLLMKLVRAIIKNSWSYLLRQGFANLYRPNNQTIILIVSIGLATAFICTLFFTQGMLMQQVNLSSSANQANMILFDIQSSQQKGVAELTKAQKLPVIQQVPIVTLRLEQVNGKTAEQVKNDSTSKVSKHAFANEYRVTYRDTLTPSEKIIEGKWSGKTVEGKDVPVSIEQNFSQRNHINVGDHLIFDVQGLSIPAIVGSVRQVNWNKIQTNFQIVFPKGVLEEAPQFYVELTHIPSVKASAHFQQAVVKQYPNVSVIDIGQVISLLDDLLDKISYIISFMSAFSIITGIVVLIASVRISKYQRIQESVLLRTLGASRKQIFTISALEYLLLGAISALTGILIALAASWLLAKYRFEIPFVVNYVPVVLFFIGTSALTLVIGLVNSRGVLSKPPLEILRSNG